ncbi:hypothetical protein FE257_006890 [Aspergillus nanangensis]|uniref:Uncharacterized protein n=1 Tax=Aspergillus nanangensis TaxID=2582783 RepID=A0AAD4CNK7_ASPNN|nr:hypothetical protein FE257_006890 [Aspergillus nanangensis]
MKTPTLFSVFFLCVAFAQPSSNNNNNNNPIKRNEQTDPSTESVIVTAPDPDPEEDPLASLSVNPTVVQTGVPLPSNGDTDPARTAAIVPSSILTAPAIHHATAMHPSASSSSSASSMVVVPAETAYASASSKASESGSGSGSETNTGPTASPSTGGAAGATAMYMSGQWAVLLPVVGVLLC